MMKCPKPLYPRMNIAIVNSIGILAGTRKWTSERLFEGSRNVMGDLLLLNMMRIAIISPNDSLCLLLKIHHYGVFESR